MINPLIYLRIILAMRNRIIHGQKRSSLKFDQSLLLNKDKKKTPLREESTQRQKTTILFRNMAIKKRLSTVDYSNYAHEPNSYKSTRQASQRKTYEGKQPKRNELLKLLNSLSSYMHDLSPKRNEAKPVFPITSINVTIQGKYIGLSSYKHRKNTKEQQQSKFILKKLQFCNKQTRRQSVQEGLNYIGGISSKSINHASQSDRYYLKMQRQKEPCCKKSRSEYIEPIAISYRVEKCQQQKKKQVKRVRCKTTNSIRVGIDQEAIDIKKI